MTVSNRLIPQSLVADDTKQPALISAYKDILAVSNSVIFLLAADVTNARVGNNPGDTPVIKARRDSLHLTNLALLSDPLASFADLESDLAVANKWQDQLRDLTPGGGCYMYDATYNAPYWEADCYGEYYQNLANIKTRYDPGFVFWSQPAATNQALTLKSDGHLCKA